MSKRTAPLIIGGIIVLIPALYFTSCAVVSGQKAKAFEHVKVGDTESQVINVMGQPKDRETNGGPRLTKYGLAACTAPCAQRLWYPNGMSLAGEAWTVELDASGHVVHTAHVTSP
jgi:hypothetical protein